jgi:hypothetical protein
MLGAEQWLPPITAATGSPTSAGVAIGGV